MVVDQGIDTLVCIPGLKDRKIELTLIQKITYTCSNIWDCDTTYTSIGLIKTLKHAELPGRTEPCKI